MSDRASSRVAAVARWALLAGAGLFGGITSAFAGDDSVRLQVVPLSATANYSVPGDASPPRLDSFVGYRITITNVGRKLSDIIVFRGRTLVRDRAEKAVFDSNEIPPFVPADPQCRTTNPNRTAIACRIGRLAPGASFGPFVVSFKTPIKKVNGTFDGPGQDFVNFRGTLIEAEDRDDFVDRDFRNRVTLVAQSDTQVTTVCPATGCTVFTGTGIPTATDHYTTEVTVPAGTRPTTVSIFESFTGSQAYPCTGNVIECWTSELTIPSNNGETFNPPLTLFLRQDLSTIQCDGGGEGISLFSCSPVPIENIVVVYVVGESTTEVFHCTGADEAGPALGEGQHECVAARTHVTGTTPNGYYEFKILSDHNGGWGTR